MTPAAAGRAALPGYSPRLAALFAAWLRRYFARQFHAVRTARAGSPPATSGPLVVYTNHPSWWDPVHIFLLARTLLPERRVYGPMDARALRKYRFFTRLGVFPVEQGSPRGAARFLATSLAVLDEPGASLWLTAEGRFTDPRQRPVRLEPGLGHLARRMSRGLVVPLALEYPFWDERDPEALSRFGRGIDVAAEPERTADEWTELFARRLEETQDALALDAGARDPELFETIVSGRAGVGGAYDAWRRARSLASGKRFDAAHGSAP